LTSEGRAHNEGTSETLITLALLAVLGFAAAGCGTTKKTALTTVTVTGTTTITDVTVNTRVGCKDWDGQSALALASGDNAREIVFLNGDATSSELHMRRLKNRSVTAFCKSSH
jgi:hypothetical protein